MGTVGVRTVEATVGTVGVWAGIPKTVGVMGVVPPGPIDVGIWAGRIPDKERNKVILENCQSSKLKKKKISILYDIILDCQF